MNGPPTELDLRTPDVRHRTWVVSRGEARPADREEVDFSWYERILGLAKGSLSRHAEGTECRDLGNPCEGLLEVLIPELERRRAGAGLANRERSVR